MNTIEELDVTGFAFTRSAWVDAAPARVYELISDVSAIGRWSPTASGVAYDDGDGPWPGAWFSGANRREDREWTTRSQVERADPGSAFSFVVGGTEDGIVRWAWDFRAEGRGSLVRQSWRLLRFDPVLGKSLAELEALREYMAGSVETTLAALARWVAEQGGSPQ
ncbi:SRPBCC family protein [Amycolatopsis solani]|uniref:SRPBCC family protein n=1 Tax=Amycolatopsis solani TaxID=3028615 RepID=UPI0025B13787|nr:SRPBCC family protein [Amycolatopsis sp. MEP2-6]